MTADVTRKGVEFVGVSHAFGPQTVLHPLDLSLVRGRFIVLLGPSGSGKTTLLSIIGGFIRPTTGQVRIFERDVTDQPPARRPTATVFQDYALFPHLSVEANVAFGPRMRGAGAIERRDAAVATLDLVGLSGMGGRRVHELSGGQRQRVALARALAATPDVLLLDEPLGALDLALRRQMQGELKAIQQRLGMTFIHVTHDQEEAMTLADEIILMNGGRVEDRGAPDRIYRRPRTEFSARFMGESNILPGRVAAASDGCVTVVSPLGTFNVAGVATAGVEAKLSLRPERILLHQTGSGMAPLGELELAEKLFQGTHFRARFRHGDRDLVAHLPPDSPLSSGDVARLGVFPEDLVLLELAGT